MNKDTVNLLKNHVDYEEAITEIIQHNVDKTIMQRAIQQSENRAQAEALYVKYRVLAKQT